MACGEPEPEWLRTARAKGMIASEVKCWGGHQPTPQTQPVAAKAKASKATPTPSGQLALTVTISPLRLVSEANAGGTRRAAIARKTAVKAAVGDALPAMAFPLPAVVTLTRLGGKSLDGDNLQRAMKAVRDMVAAWLGVDDADKRIKWRYRQRPAWVMGCRIQVREKR